MVEILKKLTSRGALAVISLAMILLFSLLLAAVVRDAEIILSREGLISVIPQGSEQIKRLEQQLKQSVPQADHVRLQGQYGQLQNEYRIASSRVGRLLAAAGADLSKGEETAIRKLELLAARSKDMEHDMSVSLAVIGLEVARGRTINTNSRAMDETRRGLYMDIQKFLRCLGVYNGEIDGEQTSTCSAVKQFQEKCGLAVDGIIGDNTLSAMKKAFEQARSH